MNTRIRYGGLGLLAVTGLYTGVWAYFSPKGWYAHFPGFGLSRLPQLGPYNEHLAKDTGAMFLALAVLTAVTLRQARDDRLVRTTGAVWLVFGVLHFGYHVQHLDMYGTRDQVLNVVTLSALLLASALLVLPVAPVRRDGPRPVRRDGPR
ncbi:hypothetical protein AB0M86_15880 [Streptomyces sp. NPDC051639]|uniref:hypothetical protein n=2 Tax=Streptomyces TaxID=1883 RepID=UPI00143EEE7D|nr:MULTISPECIES: hypothetical protein [unclassified Streptomyces]QIY64883.1 hypothetical protein HEP85_28795 [Streptomyces sp. RPA4-2]